MPILAQEVALYPENLLSELAVECEERRWWAFYTKARQEKAFARALVGYEIPFYLPLVVKDNVIRGRKVQSYVPLFGGYIFLFASDEERVLSLTTNRVSNILPVQDPEQLRQDLQSVQSLIDADAPLTVEKRIVSGDRVRIKKGSMQGLEGVVIERKGKERLLVAVTMLQQGVSVNLDDCIVEPI
ncbi:transcription termination/antitermination protein NusG [Planctomycetota bacterium]